MEQLEEGVYECLVCCDVIKPFHAIWSCSVCYHIFHLNCIKRWFKTSSKQQTGWNCPACRSPYEQCPNIYRCFCGKQQNPLFIPGEPPHSCGSICGRKRKGNCSHSCNKWCHPGSCPKCPVMSEQFCGCGKTSVIKRCYQQNFFSCQQICNKLLNCQRHRCQLVCHDGNCNECDVIIEEDCFCGKKKRSRKCSDDVIGGFSCNDVCDRLLDCGNHRCQQICHPNKCQKCQLMPENVKTCVCGQTSISDVIVGGSPISRKSCLDPIPTCNKICNKPLKCSGEKIHFCQQTCHQGECKPCSNSTTQIICRCSKTKKRFTCHEYYDVINENNEVICKKRCNKKKNCGRHTCQETCCTITEHICEMICGRKLSCNLHRCEELCHRGRCHVCYDVSFDELSCYCGQQIIFPPIQCGTKPPQCENICTRTHSCSHPVRHNCHMEDICPPCVELTKKVCNCGKILRSNIQCFIENVSCGQICDKLLPCSHHCLKICHKGNCFDVNDKCKQLCQKLRPICNHPCLMTCHDGSCPVDDVICSFPVTVHCRCGRKSKQLRCHEERKRRKKSDFMTSSNDEQIDITGYLATDQMWQMECDDVCLVEIRSKKMAEALQIDDVTASKPDDIYSQFLRDSYKNDSKFFSQIENDLKNLIENINWMNLKSKNHSFVAMKKEKRRLIHELAEVFKCQSVSYDREPNRYVCVTAIQNISCEPCHLLTSSNKPLMTPHVNLMTSSLHKDRIPLRLAPYRSAAVTSSSVTSSRPINSIDYFDATD